MLIAFSVEGVELALGTAHPLGAAIIPRVAPAYTHRV